MSETIKVPNIGDFESVDVIEVLIAPGDTVNKDDSIITLESDKAALEVPASASGVVKEVFIKVGDKVSEGSPICEVDVATEADSVSTSEKTPEEVEPAPPVPQPVADVPAVAVSPKEQKSPSSVSAVSQSVSLSKEEGKLPHASPSIRRFSRELGVDLALVTPSGPKGRILKEDVQSYVASRLAQPQGGGDLPSAPNVDFSKFGEIESKPLNRIRLRSAANLHRSWLVAPMVTQFDDADISELDIFRKAQDTKAKEQGYRVSLLPFIVKVCANALSRFPDFNSSLNETGDTQIYKKYINIGVAVDTPNGLVVPVVKDADKKGVLQIAMDLKELSGRAREGKSLFEDFQGGNFTISSLGGIGGTAFTPIVNVPEVAILGVSRAAWKQVYINGEFVPRLMLPLSLTYDHRVIDGAAAARFTTYLSQLLGDMRQLLL